MTIKFVIREVELANSYWNSSFKDFRLHTEEATKYDTYEEAQNRIATSLPNGEYQIDKIFIKE